MRDFHILSPATTTRFTISRQICWRIMRWHNGQTRRSKTCGVKESSQTAYLERNRAQRIPSWPRVINPNKAVYICADQLVIIIFRLR
jgi:hypothetical protein